MQKSPHPLTHKCLENLPPALTKSLTLDTQLLRWVKVKNVGYMVFNCNEISSQNTPRLVIFSSKIKNKFMGGAQQPPQTPLPVETGTPPFHTLPPRRLRAPRF